MALTPGDIAQRVGETAGNLLRAAPGVAANAAALYIKEGTPPSLIPNIGVAVARQACRRYADNPDGPPGAVAAALEEVCRPYLDDIGYGAPPSIDLPFRGGQCCGVTYQYTYSFRNPNTGTIQDSLQTISNAQIVGLFERSNQPAQPTKSGGPRIRSCSTGVTQDLPLGTTFESAPLDQSISNISVVGGAPDTCGNPPPDFRPPVPPPSPGPRVEPYNPGPGIDIDIDLEFGPEGNITFNIGTGPITIDPFPGGGGGGDNPGIDQPGTAPSSGLPPGDIGSPAAPADTGEDGVAAGCAPPNSVLVGIKIAILDPLPEVSEYDPLVRRGVCYAYMGTPGNLALNPEGVALRSGQMLFAPLDNLTCYEVRANTGYNLRVTPYYRALELDEV